MLHTQHSADEYLNIAKRYDNIQYSKATTISKHDTNRDIQRLLWTINKTLLKMKDPLNIHKLNAMKSYLQTVCVLEDGTKMYHKHNLNR